jgi:hypothetical protein
MKLKNINMFMMNAMLLKPYDQCWNVGHELYNKWMNFSTNVFQKMKCFAICGILKLIHQNKHFRKMNSIYNKLYSIEDGCTSYGSNLSFV